MTLPNYDIIGACAAIRAEAANLQGINSAYNLKRKTGMLDFVTSGDNGPGVNAKLISFQDKIATLQVFYDQRTKECQITDDCAISVCDTGSTPVRKQFLFEADNCLYTPVREYSISDMEALCKDTPTFMRERGFSDLRAAKEHLSMKLLAEIDAMKGKNLHFQGAATAYGGSKTIDLIATDSFGQSIPLVGNYAQIPLDYENNQLNGVPAFIGQGNFELFWKLHGWSCCNSTTPYGTGNVQGDGNFYVDQAANAVLGNNDILMVAPGAVKMVTFTENSLAVKMGTNSNTYQSIVVPDPDGYPFSWNFDLYYDICDKKWKSVYSILWGVFNTFQRDSFASNADTPGSPDCSDELDDMTGVFGYSIN